jgi:putative endonuclease
VKPKYKKMIRGMKEESPPPEKQWHLYILECSDGSLYTGITNDLDRRLGKHNAGTASKYTRVRRPVVLKFTEPCGTRVQALVRECQVKELPRSKKLELIHPRKPIRPTPHTPKSQTASQSQAKGSN